MSLFDIGAREIIETLKNTDVNVLTPIEALGALNSLCAKAKEERG